jgi:hypothetical protein
MFPFEDIDWTRGLKNYTFFEKFENSKSSWFCGLYVEDLAAGPTTLVLKIVHGSSASYT